MHPHFLPHDCTISVLCPSHPCLPMVYAIHRINSPSELNHTYHTSCHIFQTPAGVTRAMKTNDRIILDQVLAQRKTAVDPASSDSVFFELFTAEQVLKDFDLSYDEIESGLAGGGQDGGIDAIYLIVNGELALDDPDYSHLKKDITLDLMIIQSKTHAGFQETPIERFITVSDDIFDLSKPVSALQGVYNSTLLDVIKNFRSLHQQLASKFPRLNISYYYASKGDTPADTVNRKVEKLRAQVTSHFPNAEFQFEFLGASQLLELARTTPQTTYSLTLAENPISSEGQIGFVCLVRLRDFYKFITEESGSLRRQVFEANVRDYQGHTQVNDQIQSSLKNPTKEDFWWLNNGVSILATKASQGGKTLTIENPQIVNGLQTSTEIYNYFKVHNTDNEQRKILLRVVVPLEEESRDRIIKATNSQTTIQQSSLRATDKIHRDIEEYLRPKGLFYDRRKNYYKNEGKPRSKIVGIPHLAQAAMAIVLQRPDTARARPSSLLKKDEDYQRVFSQSYPVHMYYICAEVMRRVEQYLRLPEADLQSKDRNNLRFYVAIHVISKLHSPKNITSESVAETDITCVDDKTILTSLEYVKKKYFDLGGTDQVAKGYSLLKAIEARE